MGPHTFGGTMKEITTGIKHVRSMMSNLDNEIGDCSQEMKDSIDTLWDAIDYLETEIKKFKEEL